MYTFINFIPHLVHVPGVKLDAGDAAGASKAGAVLSRVRHVEDETILKKNNNFEAFINDVSPEILCPSSRGTRDWRRKLQSAHLKTSSNGIKHNHPLCTLPELPVPHDMQLTGRGMSVDTVLARSGSWYTATELIMSLLSWVARSSVPKYSPENAK